jgi:hypothetical protein
MFLQFLPFSSTPYAQTVQPPETGETGEDVEVNPSASLNEWLVPGFPNSQELEVTNISKFVSCIRLLFKRFYLIIFQVATLDFLNCCHTVIVLLHWLPLFAATFSICFC